MKIKKLSVISLVVFLCSAGSVFAQGGYNGPNQQGQDVPIADNGRGILLSDIIDVKKDCTTKTLNSILDQITRSENVNLSLNQESAVVSNSLEDGGSFIYLSSY